MASKAATKPAEGDSSTRELATVDHSKGQVLATQADLMSGSSDFGQADLSIPFLRIVQGLSPWIQPQDPKYDENVKQGMIAETVTPRFFKGADGIIVIPVMYQRSYTEWKPNRGGMVADHGTDSSILAKCTKTTNSDGKTVVLTPEGNELAEAAQYFVLYAAFDENAPGGLGSSLEQAILTMAGTQWKTSRDWNTNIQRVRLQREDGSVIKNPLPFAMAYRLTTVGQKKDNYSFFGWTIKPHAYTLTLPHGEEVIEYASRFRKLAATGKVKGDDGGVTEDPNVEGPIPF